MSFNIVFVVGNVGSVEYLAPLWKRWLKQKNTPKWRIIAGPSARLSSIWEKLPNLPLINVQCNEQGFTEWLPTLNQFKCVVASATYWDFEEAACNYARLQKQPVFRFLDTWYDYHKRLSGHEGHILPVDTVFMIDQQAINEAIDQGIPASMLTSIGQPAWENIKSMPKGDNRDVIFVGQPIEQYYGNRLGYTQKSCWQLLQKVTNKHPDLFRKIYYLPHPEETNHPENLDELNGKLIYSKEQIYNVGTVLGMYSSLMTDAFLAGRLVVSLQSDPQGDEMCSLVRHNYINRATSEEELLAFLSNPLCKPKTLSSSLEGSCDRLEKYLQRSVH